MLQSGYLPDCAGVRAAKRAGKRGGVACLGRCFDILS
jgi:hypothetical protein